jgi:type II secretory ATPase GspE/PulE/Tfp pilus assembly ATPase PilB-like protein
MNDEAISASAPSAPTFLEQLIQQAERARASDIHLQMFGKAAQVSLRLDGMMSPPTNLPEPVAERVFGRIKFLSKLKTYQESLPQDGRIDKAEVGAATDIRVATYPTVSGEKIVLRFFTNTETPTINELKFPEPAVSELESFLRGSSGLLLLTGPAGSGKTTTIYACLRRLAELGGRHIITIEDPVEQIVPGIMQTEVSEPRGLTFAKAARHLLRQDPQVLVIGEVRDDETANIVVRAAMTGHLVISTLHAGSCSGVIERLQMMCADSYAIASSIELIINQRLVRRVCEQCRGERCEACLQTGYHGRVPVLEWLRLGENVPLGTLRDQLRANEPASVQPKHSIREAARDLVKSGITDAAEFERIFSR